MTAKEPSSGSRDIHLPWRRTLRPGRSPSTYPKRIYVVIPGGAPFGPAVPFRHRARPVRAAATVDRLLPGRTTGSRPSLRAARSTRGRTCGHDAGDVDAVIRCGPPPGRVRRTGSRRVFTR